MSASLLALPVFPFALGLLVGLGLPIKLELPIGLGLLACSRLLGPSPLPGLLVRLLPLLSMQFDVSGRVRPGDVLWAVLLVLTLASLPAAPLLLAAASLLGASMLGASVLPTAPLLPATASVLPMLVFLPATLLVAVLLMELLSLLAMEFDVSWRVRLGDVRLGAVTLLAPVALLELLAPPCLLVPSGSLPLLGLLASPVVSLPRLSTLSGLLTMPRLVALLRPLALLRLVALPGLSTAGASVRLPLALALPLLAVPLLTLTRVVLGLLPVRALLSLSRATFLSRALVSLVLLAGLPMLPPGPLALAPFGLPLLALSLAVPFLLAVSSPLAALSLLVALLLLAFTAPSSVWIVVCHE